MDREETIRSDENETARKAPLEPVYPWKKAWQTSKVIWPQLVYISLVCMSIPQYLLFIFSTAKAHELGQPLKINQPISLENGIGVLRDFALHYASVGWMVVVLFLVGAFTAIALSGQVARSEPISVLLALKSARRALFPKGLIFLVVFGLGGLLTLNIAVQVFPGQILKFLALILGVLISAVPTLMTIDRSRPFAAFTGALRMNYVTSTGMSKWSAFFLLLTYQLLALNFIALTEWISASLLQLDITLHVGREGFFASSQAWPFGKAIYIVEGFYTLAFSLITMAFLVLNSSFIYELYRRHTLGRNISIVV